MSIIAKYYYHYLGYRKKKIIELLTDYMDKYYPPYAHSKATWDESIEKLASNVGKFALFEIDGVWITQKEIDTITALNNKTLERLAFTMLCLAKLNNLRNPKNNNWVKQPAKEVFTLARISCQATERYMKLNKLGLLGFLEFSKRNDNLSCRVTYVDDDSQKILFISDFRELGYEYKKFMGENYIHCRECGVLFKSDKKQRRYCSSCAEYTPMMTKVVSCIDCGEEFVVNSKNTKSKRCPYCQEIYDKQRRIEAQRIRRKKE